MCGKSRHKQNSYSTETFHFFYIPANDTFYEFFYLPKEAANIFNVSSERREAELWLVCRELKFSNCYIKHA